MASELSKHIIVKYLTPYSDRFGHCTRLQRMLWLPGMVAQTRHECFAKPANTVWCVPQACRHDALSSRTGRTIMHALLTLM